MTRFGWILLAIFVAAAAGFVLLIRPGQSGGVTAEAPPPPPPGASPEPVIGPSGLAIPVAGIGSAALADTFGQDRAGGARSHGALDIPAPRGTIVMAAAPGRVEKLFDSKDGGRTVYIRSDDGGWIYYYAHLDQVLPNTVEGACIARAQAIATVGSTGNANPEGPHLHFEVKRMQPGETWYQGTGVNPYPLLVR